MWLLTLLVVALAATTWLAVRALQAKTELETSVALVSQLRDQLVAQDITAAEETLAELTPRVQNARELTSDPVWLVAEFTPVLGSNLAAVRQLAAATDSIVVDAVPPLMEIVGDFVNDGLTTTEGALNTALFEAAIPRIDVAAATIEAAVASVDAIDTSNTISQVTDAQATLAEQLNTLSPVMKQAQEILPIVAPALGSEAPRTYLILFQNNAELRSLGGIPGSIVPLTLADGAISLGEQLGKDDFPAYEEPVVTPPPGVTELYRDAFATSILNSTVRPDFASGAEVARTLWEKYVGTKIDGVIAIDPVALSYILRAGEPIQLPTGDVMTGDNAVSLLVNEVYLRYPGETEASRDEQGAYFAGVIDGLFRSVMGGGLDLTVLGSGVVQAVEERRLLLWSANEAETALIDLADLSGSLPKSDASTDRIGLYTQDAIGSKMDYYLDQNVTFSQASCRADGRENYRVSVNNTNLLTEDQVDDLTFYIVGDGSEGVTPGDIRIDLFAYAPPGAEIVGLSVDGAAKTVDAFSDGDYPVSRIRTTIEPGVTQNVTFDLIAGAPGTRELASILTPMVRATPVESTALDCASLPGE
ncbi:DUF4012 domain-containing protein [Cryobacterium zongtaii]|uniref:DUF4012 domain-containing protein n=1 Tax=Cryobacterium zongtaii TaxID=1259217 RepID=UPI0013FD451A|nr:DUF4012 domain-containing protein [Cryobacterium zongtaii]